MSELLDLMSKESIEEAIRYCLIALEEAETEQEKDEIMAAALEFNDLFLKNTSLE